MNHRNLPGHTSRTHDSPGPPLIPVNCRDGNWTEWAFGTGTALPGALSADSYRMHSFVVAEVELVIEAGEFVRAAEYPRHSSLEIAHHRGPPATNRNQPN
jgi:hypothetical protein